MYQTWQSVICRMTICFVEIGQKRRQVNIKGKWKCQILDRKEKSEIYGLETNVILQEDVETVGEGTPDQEH